MPVYVGATNCDYADTWLYHGGPGESLEHNAHCMNKIWDTEPPTSNPDTHVATATIKTAYAGLGGVDQNEAGVEVDTETRPKNMKLVFIIRIE